MILDMRIYTLIILFLLSACNFDVYGNEEELSAVQTSNMSNDESTTGTPNESSEEENGANDDIFKENLDVGESELLCQKIDFLFVVDNSGSMGDNQENIINNFPKFIEGISSLTGYQDFHIGVVTTDDYMYNHPNCRTLGGLVAFTGGNNSSNSACGPWKNGNFMTGNEIFEGFECAALVGTEGASGEQTIGAFINSLDPFLTSEDQCNEGFLREDAILVVVFITDEEDISTPGNLTLWKDKVEFYKGIENVIVLGLVPLSDSMCDCIPTPEVPTQMVDFINLFKFSYIDDVCLENYGEFFTDSLDIIKTACIPVE